MRGACGLHGCERMWDRRMGGKISNWRKDDGGKQSKMGSGSMKTKIELQKQVEDQAMLSIK